MLQKIKESAEFLQNKTNSQPKVGIILGTGLGGLVNEIDIKHSISYKDIPNFPLSTVEGHQWKINFRKSRRKRSSRYARTFSFL